MSSNKLDLLKKSLANVYGLYLKTQNYHWNVKGSDFYQLHIFLEGQYKDLAETVDDLAERVVTLGEKAPGSFRDFQSLMTIDEAPADTLSADKMINDLLLSYQTTVECLRTILPFCAEDDDAGTEDLVSSIIGDLEKKAWMLKAHIS
ncbi:MAG: DNA starvation/stationary phase protection protein [Rickettsiales bacterium]|nr:DNA starvation/stationary phase protection protein [Rickettsiales bacterium]|tara:strand:+ start:50847 stop:51287 length:441 start_codon:yes stop_codon:yes gene_type:complete